MSSIESRYIEHIDRSKFAGQGPATEQAVIKFFQTQFANMEVRQATPEEDAGDTGFTSGKIIDAVAYLDHKPALALQITSTVDKGQRLKKMEELRSRPFLRLAEMKPQDPSIPRVLVYVEAKDIIELTSDFDFSKPNQVGKQILESTISSLEFDLLNTKNPEEIKRLGLLLQMLRDKKDKSEKGAHN